jgi:hypothetical protein
MPPCPFYTETGFDTQTNFGKMRRAPPITTMAGQVDSTPEHILEKREIYPKPVKSFINNNVLTCRLQPGKWAQGPPWPGVRDITTIENKLPGSRTPQEVSILANMKRWYIGRQDSQGLPFLTKVNTDALKTSGPNGQQVFIGSEQKPQASIDHICMFTSTYYTDFLLY